MRWTGKIERVRTKVVQLVGVLGRAAGVLGGQSLLSLYNGLVLPHLLYCLMVLGDFREGRNATVGGSLLRLQKGLAGMIAGKRGIYHADPLLAKHGMLKVGPWGTSTGSSLGSTPGDSGMAGYQITRQLMLDRTEGVQGYGTRSARAEIYLSTRDHQSVGYRVPKEWASLMEAQRGLASLSAFKRGSRGGFLSDYGAFECRVVGCQVCRGGGTD